MAHPEVVKTHYVLSRVSLSVAHKIYIELEYSFSAFVCSNKIRPKIIIY